jgi:hypothetical protein
MASKQIIRSLIVGLAFVGIASTPFLSPMGKQAQAASTVQDTPIQDPLIQEGLNSLRSHQEPIQLPNGELINGQVLAEFIFGNQIPVVWGSEDICGGGSCSIMYCGLNGNCSYENGRPGIDPIYINLAVQTQVVGKMSRLTQELAHEAFHRMQYFGLGSDSLLEEYWAFYVGAQMVQADWPNFNGVDPQNPEQLLKWFKIHGLNGYFKLPPYPGDAVSISQIEEGGQTFADSREE